MTPVRPGDRAEAERAERGDGGAIDLEAIRVAPGESTRLSDGGHLVVIDERAHLDPLARRDEARSED